MSSNYPKLDGFKVSLPEDSNYKRSFCNFST